MSSYVELAVLEETDTVAEYMQAKFRAVMRDLGSIFQKPDSFVPFPGEWSLECACEVCTNPRRSTDESQRKE
jgi:hypothetical protein